MKILHYFSKINTFVFLLSLLYFINKYTVGWILRMIWHNNIIFELLYITLSLILIFKFIKIGSPYENYIKKPNS